MTEALNSLFDSPPGPSKRPPPRSPSRSRSPSRTPSRGRRSSEPLFLSPNGTATPIRSRPQFQPLLDYGLEFDEPERDPFEEPPRNAGAGGPEVGGIRTADLGNYDPLAPILGEDPDEPARKKRKPIPKIDAERLMGEYGLPALMKDAKRFKVRGKGHEAQDLKSLLSIYQIWAHRMFPRGEFMDTMGRVENVLRTRRMENAMKGYRDAFHPPPPSPPHHDLEQDPGSPSPHHDNQRISTSSPAPLFNPRDESEIDQDELAAMEEMEKEEGLRRNGNGGDEAPPPLEEEDDWEGLYD